MDNLEVLLNNEEFFRKDYEIPKEKLLKAIEDAEKKLEKRIEKFGAGFTKTASVDMRYQESANDNWGCGLLTGTYLMAYALTKNEKFKEVAKKQLETYRERYENKVGMYDHDVGFVYTPSCLAAYKLWGDEELRKLLLEVVDFYYNFSYSKKGGFVIRVAAHVDQEWACRTMVDSMLNIPLLFWAGQETGKQEYTDAAISQSNLTRDYLTREDGSTYHHYQFDVETHEPVKGVTWQGYSDESCWSRGQAWCILGFPIAYSYVKDESYIEVQKNETYYMLNHLPQDLIPKWDLVFTEEKEQPQDSSAGVITVCGMLEMCKFLPKDSQLRSIYQNASARLLEAVIDHCAKDESMEYDGLICHVSAAVPQKMAIDECAIYGDYFYLEALMRYMNPEWNSCW